MFSLPIHNMHEKWLSGSLVIGHTYTPLPRGLLFRVLHATLSRLPSWPTTVNTEHHPQKPKNDMI